MAQKKYYPISYKRINQLIRYAGSWEYGTKDTCKYVAETLINNMEDRDIKIKDSLYSDLIGLVHDVLNGRVTRYKRVKIEL